MSEENEIPEVEIKIKRKPGRKPGQKAAPKFEPAPPAPSLSVEQMLMLVEQMKKPTVLEQSKLDKEEAQNAKMRRMRVEGAMREQQVKDWKAANCTHRSQGSNNQPGKHAFVAQVNADGYFRPICKICHTVFPAIKASNEQVTGGVNLDLRYDLTAEILIAWSRRAA
jgi:protein-disulfide isomerase